MGIYNETILKKTLRKHKDDSGVMYKALKDFAVHRTAVNKALLKRVRQIQALVGFTGEATRGVHAAVEHAHEAEDHNNAIDLSDEEDGRDEGDHEDENDVENDTKFHSEMDSIGNFFTDMTRDWSPMNANYLC